MKTQSFPLVILFLIFLSLSAKAKLVDTITSKTVAIKFLKTISKNNSIVSSEIDDLQLVSTYYSNGLPSQRIYAFANQTGFVIVSAEDRTIPVLGYSFESNFDLNTEIPNALNEWLDDINNQIREIRINNYPKTAEIGKLWEKYTSNSEIKSGAAKDVAPLLTTTWDQGCGYNQYCPADAAGACGYTYAGCVATAMGQIMKYHSYPTTGQGSNSYSSSYGTLSADFGATTYNWSSMPSPHGMYNADVQQLLFHIGVSVWMVYGPTGSGIFSTNTARSALVDNFKYSYNSLWNVKANYTEENWRKLMIKELDAGRPLLYSGQSVSSGKHAFVLDGYQGIDYFHVNWGWSGYYNGYFYLNALNPSTANFTDNQAAIIGIEPSSSFPGLDCSSAVPLTCGINYNGTTVGAPSIVNKYTGSAYNATGSEVVHSITTLTPGNITISLSSSADLAVFLLSDCSIDSLKAYGNNSLSYNSQPGTYYVVVDGLYNDEGAYSITFNCPTGDADLVISSASINPYYVESLQSGVSMNCTVENIGNANASASKVKYYLSTDNFLDGSDIFIDESSVSALAIGETSLVTKIVSMPNGLTPGSYNIIFVADAENDVVESDETLNNYLVNAEVPATGSINCSSAVELVSGVRYFGNTQTNGSPNIASYSCAWGSLSAKEVIHKITATYSGVATIEFSEKIIGDINLMVFSSCNENSCLDLQTIWNPADTLISFNLTVNAGAEYFFVTDGETGIEGAYSILINMPDECPNPAVNVFGALDRCDGSGPVHFMAESGHPYYIWYKDGVVIDGANSNMLMIDSSGEYWVVVNENGCDGSSEHLIVTYSSAPDGNTISASGSTSICEGNNVELTVNASAGYTIDWFLDGSEISGANGYSFAASQSGIYTAKITNVSCSAFTNEITVSTLAIPTVDLGSDIEICEGESADFDAGSGFATYSWSNSETSQIISVNTSGTYQVSVTDANGCEGVDEVEVIFYPLPEIYLGNDTTVCGTSINLDAGLGFDSYLWNNGSSTQTINADTTGFGYGTFTFFVSVGQNTCYSTDSITVTFDPCTFSSEIERGINANVYPNPTSGLINIEFESGKKGSIMLKIYDVQGKCIFSFSKLINNSLVKGIDLSNYPNGLYLLSIQFEGSIINKQILKTK
ncbi:MAG: C10 family peptidase [Bacteroidales bacterium]|nr:C10 family peptidase [Bacteroidales bacterium]